MAEIRVTHDDPDATLPGGVAGTGMNRTPETDPEHLLPAAAGAGTPGTVAASTDPDLVRDEIERTRARMSQTIDSIESALLRKKEQIEEKLDVTAPVRERVQSQPLMYAGGVFGAGLLLGFLTGGKDEDDDLKELRRMRAMSRAGAIPTMEVGLGAGSADYGFEASSDAKWKRRAREWEKQARDLRRACERQEREIRSLRASVGRADRQDEENGLLGTVSRGLSGAVAGSVSRLVGGNAGEMEVEVDLEQPTPHMHPYAGAAAGDHMYPGEMELEVELEQPYGTPRPSYGRPAPRTYAREAAYTRPMGGEMEVEVELEQPHSRRRPALLGAVGVGVAAAVAGVVARLLSERHAEELDVVVELEQPARPRPAVVAEYDAYGTEGEMLYERPETGENLRYGRPAMGEMEVEVDLEDRGGYVDRGYDYGPR